jgi:hypothetical protein
MCTVTYFPKGERSYILTSNRDESPLRATNNVVEREINGRNVKYPEDVKGGTWIAMDDKGMTLCVLNGAKEKHKHTPPYKISRGLMLLAYWEYENTASFLQHYDFKWIEPFTLLIAKANKLVILYWNGKIKEIKIADRTKNYIFSSSTLYDAKARKDREDWFYRYINNYHQIDADNVLEIHHHGNATDPFNAYIMNREEKVKTVSMTQVLVREGYRGMRYLGK